MTKHLRLLLAAISALIINASFSQVTEIQRNGIRIEGGIVLPNGKVIMSSENRSGIYTIEDTSVKLITNLTNGVDPETIYKGEAYFVNSGKLYVTDGTTAGTHAVAPIGKTGNGYFFTPFKFNNLLYFIANDGEHGNELWSTDGTTANTGIVKDINGDSSNSFPNSSSYYPYYTTQFFINGSYVLFTAYGADSTFSLYKLTASGISLLKNNFADSTTVTYDTTGGKTFFTATSGSTPTGSSQLWVTDGSSTSLLYNPGAGVSIYNPRLVNGNFVFEVSNNTTNTSAVWSTDGTAANTQLLTNLNAPFAFTSNLNNKLVFAVGTDTTGNELWSTDGTAANTQLLKTINVKINGSNVVNDKIVFTTFSDSAGNELWSTDGTAANTKPIKHINADIDYPDIILNNKLIFDVGTPDLGRELWTTDGTAANTTVLKDIRPGSYGSDPLFPYNEGAYQNSITSGTYTQVKRINYLTPFKGKYYFTADDGVHGRELWSTDGTADGTTLIKDINPGLGDGVAGSRSFFYTTTGIYFNEDDGYNTEYGLWVTDGTSAGTKMIEGYSGGDRTSSYLFVYNHQLYFNNHYYLTSGDSDLYKIDTTLSILPVGLSNFTASLQASSVLLNWQTASEINTDHFCVERSVDGVHFNNIGNVKATGTSSTIHDYTLYDYNALHLGSSTLYYRLKTTDKDGKYTYSSIIKLQLHGGEFAYSLSPNPVHSQLTVSFTTGNATKQASLRITDANGKPVYEKSLQGLQPGSVQRYINVAGFESGIYYVQLITDSGTKTLKFVKQ